MKLKVDFKNTVGKIKPMNAVNNGPVYTDNGDQNLTNLPDFREANIPFARTHDSSICYDYGGEHTVDIHNIFTDFDADPYSPESYDFTLTDIYLGTIMRAGAKVFYRLGSKIEHWPKHYGIMPPKDYQKWAVVCEHIIMHMNEGWADGYHMGIEYWEIWNEPDFNDKCWTGTPEEFYDFFATAAKYLKARFPSLKIGGPAVCGYNEKWLDAFFEKMREENVPMDFYSWHCYGSKVSDFTSDARRHRAMLDRHGYTDTESILNEWNYVCGWGGDGWKRSLETEASLKGAAFIAAAPNPYGEKPPEKTSIATWKIGGKKATDTAIFQTAQYCGAPMGELRTARAKMYIKSHSAAKAAHESAAELRAKTNAPATLRTA